MSVEKKRLGKGLGALIPNFEESSDDPSSIIDVAIMRVTPNPYQPRKVFDDEKLRELSESIKKHGVMQPIIVTPADRSNYILVAGERRWRAAKLAGEEYVPAVVREVGEHTLLQFALIENLQREDLNPIEEATAYRRLIEEANLTQEELSQQLGKSRSSIANTMRLLSLPDKLQKAILDGLITEGQARPLLSVKEMDTQHKIAQEIIKKNLSAREVEKRVAGLVKKNSRQESGRTGLPADENLFMNDIKEALQTCLGTKVRISKKKSGGTIEIDFFGEEDLDRVVSLITGSQEWER